MEALERGYVMYVYAAFMLVLDAVCLYSYPLRCMLLLLSIDPCPWRFLVPRYPSYQLPSSTLWSSSLLRASPTFNSYHDTLTLYAVLLVLFSNRVFFVDRSSMTTARWHVLTYALPARDGLQLRTGVEIQAAPPVLAHLSWPTPCNSC
jgi:hypothetical protein